MIRSLRLLPVLFCALLAGACGARGKHPGGTPAAAASTASARPPEPPADSKDGVFLTLRGGKFGEKTDLRIAVNPETTKFEVLDGGLRLSIAEPQPKGAMKPSAWGFWLFAEGKLEEDAVMRCRTGTQLNIDGGTFAPPSPAEPAGTPSGHLLDATLAIVQADPALGPFEAEITGTLVAPDGKVPIKLEGQCRLPWPSSLRP